MTFDASLYAKLHRRVFTDTFTGYTPKVVESPNGDGKLDSAKRYAHIKMSTVFEPGPRVGHRLVYPDLLEVLEAAHFKALGVAVELGLPPEWWPSIDHSALRVLEYPPGAGSASHTDFSLFTVNLYRNIPNRLAVDWTSSDQRVENVFMGELMQAIWPFVKPTRHEVLPADPAHQYSMVYFAIPDHARKLPTGQTVGEWLEERTKRSRYNV